MKRSVILPSGGSGKRFGSETPKQYIEVDGKPMIYYTLEVFQKCELIDEVIIAAQSDYFNYLEELKDQYKLTKVKRIVAGGKERQNSVYNGLVCSELNDEDIIAVHDAARPLLPQKVLEEALISAEKFDNVLVAIKAKDSLLKGGESVDEYLNRSEIYYAQTPQIFKYKNLIEAFEKANRDNYCGTDESMLVKRAGFEVKIVEGSSMNFKITTKEDLEIFNAIIRRENTL